MTQIAGVMLLVFGFFSPVVAIACAVFFYIRNPKRRIPLIGYAVILLVCGIIAYVIGMVGGISWACSSSWGGNLCGLWGFFIVGPIAAALAIFFVSASIMGLRRDGSPTGRIDFARHFEFGTPDTGDEKAVPVDATSKVSSVCSKLWRGQYSLSRSFWGFFLLGTCVGWVVLQFASRSTYTDLIYKLVYLAYVIAAGVGVWRSANANANNEQYEIIAAKAFVVLTISYAAIGTYLTALDQFLWIYPGLIHPTFSE